MLTIHTQNFLFWYFTFKWCKLYCPPLACHACWSDRSYRIWEDILQKIKFLQIFPCCFFKCKVNIFVWKKYMWLSLECVLTLSINLCALPFLSNCLTLTLHIDTPCLLTLGQLICLYNMSGVCVCILLIPWDGKKIKEVEAAVSPLNSFEFIGLHTVVNLSSWIVKCSGATGTAGRSVAVWLTALIIWL